MDALIKTVSEKRLQAQSGADSNNLIALGTSTLMALPGKGLNQGVRKFLEE